MNITTLGISLASSNKNVTLHDLFTRMQDTSGVPDTSKSVERRFYIDNKSDSDFVFGLIITVRDQKRFLQISDEKGNFSIKVANVTGDHKIMEFNFLVICKKNGLGLYQYYRGSCSPATFGSYLRTRYRAISDESRDAQLAHEAGHGDLSSAREKAIRSAHRAGLSLALITHNEGLVDRLASYKDIRSISFEVADLNPVIEYARPLEGRLHRVHQRISFNRANNIRELAGAIVEFLPFMRVNTARVQVIDDDDDPLSIKISGNPINYGEEDYDELASKLDNLDVTKFSSHELLQSLKDKCKTDYKDTFFAGVEDDP